MASYHFDLKTFSRRRGQSAVAAASYRSGELLHCERDGLDKIPARNPADVLHKKLIGWKGSREQLWNAVEAAEKRKDATIARELIVALPYELSQDERNELSETIAQHIATELGVAVDLCVHRPPRGEKNHHAHLLFSTRRVENEELTSKTRVLDDIATGPATVRSWREKWEVIVNLALEKRPDVSPISRKPMRSVGLTAATKQGPAIAAILRRNRAQESAKIEQLNAEIETANRELLAAIQDEQYKRRRRTRDRLVRMAGNLSRTSKFRDAATELRTDGIECRAQEVNRRGSQFERIDKFVDIGSRQTNRARRLAIIAKQRAEQTAQLAGETSESPRVGVVAAKERSSWVKNIIREYAEGVNVIKRAFSAIVEYTDRIVKIFLDAHPVYGPSLIEFYKHISEGDDYGGNIPKAPELPKFTDLDLNLTWRSMRMPVKVQEVADEGKPLEEIDDIFAALIKNSHYGLGRKLYESIRDEFKINTKQELIPAKQLEVLHSILKQFEEPPGKWGPWNDFEKALAKRRSDRAAGVPLLSAEALLAQKDDYPV